MFSVTVMPSVTAMVFGISSTTSMFSPTPHRHGVVVDAEADGDVLVVQRVDDEPGGVHPGYTPGSRVGRALDHPRRHAESPEGSLLDIQDGRLARDGVRVDNPSSPPSSAVSCTHCDNSRVGDSWASTWECACGG
jgi:hypothetical protein